MSDDLTRIREILAEHEGKDFVKRILDPENSPFLDAGGGKRSTHMMATGEADGVHYVYPTIARIEGELTRMSPQEAFRHAMDSGEAIPFETADEALWFSKNYKKVWAKQ